MTYLAPLALIGVLLLILPIVVHLFKPRKMRQTPFSSLRWLKQSHQRLSRRIQWHQWLLFLLRAGCILLLVVALAKPLVGFWGATPVDRFIVVDTSRSMAHQVEKTSSMEHATKLANRLVQTARVGDRTAVVLAGPSPRLIAPPSADASSAAGLLAELQASQADASLTGVLPLVRSLLPRHKDREIELVFLTDNLQERWQQNEVQSFMHELPNKVRVKVIDVGPGPAANAWIASTRILQFGDDEDRVLRVEIGSNKEVIKDRSIHMTRVKGLDDDKHTFTVKPGTLTRVDFRVPARVNLQGQTAELRLEPADALPSDDLFFLNLDTNLALRVLLIEPDALGTDGRRVGLSLQTAMEELANAKHQALEVSIRPAAAVTASDIHKADVVVLAGVPDLADAIVESVEARVRAGAGLALFLGPNVKPEFVNQRLHRLQQPAEGLLPFKLKNPGWQIEGKAGELTNLRWTHPVLTAFRDQVPRDFTQSRFRTYANLIGPAGKSDTILARFDDDVPALIEHPLGAGRVLIFNMSANDAWGDLPRKSSFVPLLDRTLVHLSAGGERRNFLVGAPVSLPLPNDWPKAAVKAMGPGDVKLSPRLVVQRGQTHLHFDEIAQAGVYRVEGPNKKEIVFTVNTARTDSPLNTMETATLTDWWAPASVEVVSAESARQQLDQQSSHWPLWPALVLCAGLLLVAETVYVHRLFPRANPKAADAVVPQRGVMKPVE